MEEQGYHYGIPYNFNYIFFDNPREFELMHLFQAGDRSCEPGLHVEMHKQLCFEITCVTAGEGRVYCDGKQYDVTEGDIFLNVPEEMHAIEVPNAKSFRYLYLGWTFPDHVSEIFEPMVRFFKEPIENRQEKDKRNIAFHLTALVNELYGNVSLSSEMINAYILQILCLIYRTYHNSELVTLPTRKADNVGSTIRRVIHYIDTHIFFIENVGTISKELSYSSSYLSRIFRAKTGMTLQNYLNYKKIEKSTDLLVNENFSVTEISDKLHYKTVQSFSKIFKRLIGISPANYLKELQKKEK